MAFVEKDTQTLDGAVLDINLHGKKSYPVADALISRHSICLHHGIRRGRYRGEICAISPLRKTLQRKRCRRRTG